MLISHTAVNAEHQRDRVQSGSPCTGRRFRTRRLSIQPIIGLSLAALVITLPFFPPHDSGVPSESQVRLVGSSVAPAQVPSRPRHVAGYSLHAKQRMAEREITDAEVVALVESPQVGLYQDDNDTWILQDPQTYLAVVINKNAFVVTVYYG